MVQHSFRARQKPSNEIFQQNVDWNICKTCNRAEMFLDAISVLSLYLQACEKTCYQRNVIEQCQCSDAYYPSSNASAFNNVIVPVCSASNITQGARRNAVSFSHVIDCFGNWSFHTTLQPVPLRWNRVKIREIDAPRQNHINSTFNMASQKRSRHLVYIR